MINFNKLCKKYIHEKLQIFQSPLFSLCTNITFTYKKFDDISLGNTFTMRATNHPWCRVLKDKLFHHFTRYLYRPNASTGHSENKHSSWFNRFFTEYVKQRATFIYEEVKLKSKFLFLTTYTRYTHRYSASLDWTTTASQFGHVKLKYSFHLSARRTLKSFKA